MTSLEKSKRSTICLLFKPAKVTSAPTLPT